MFNEKEVMEKALKIYLGDHSTDQGEKESMANKDQEGDESVETISEMLVIHSHAITRKEYAQKVSCKGKFFIRQAIDSTKQEIRFRPNDAEGDYSEVIFEVTDSFIASKLRSILTYLERITRVK